LSTSANINEKSSTRSLRFTQQRDFRNALTARVNAYLRDNKIPARDVPAMYLKTIITMAWWLGVYLLLLLGHFPPLVNVGLCVMWAMAIASVGFNVVHDANHSGYSDNPRLNRLISFSAEFLGMSGFRWRVKHNVWHHTYTNIAGFDDDVETYGLMRLTPRAPWKPLHKVQVFYFPLVYGLIGFDFIMRDFMMALIGKSDANHVYPKLSTSDKIIFWVGKVFYFTVMLVIPMLVFPWWQVLIGYLIVMLTVGLVMGVIFQLAHINRDAAFPEPVGDPPYIEKEWAVHQVETTVDFAPHNRLLSWYIGGLNYQIEHHLFPHICHLNYPRLAPIIRATCEEFGIRYVCYATWREAMADHWRELRLLGHSSELAHS
jgi:linoleoyl-CoA desaturase